MSIKLVVSDIDGTLVDSSERIAPELLQAIALLEQRGIAFTFATGRSKELTDSFVGALQLRHPYIINNGACIFRGDSCLREHGFSAQPVVDVLLEADRMGLTVTLTNEYQEFAISDTDYTRTHRGLGGRFRTAFPLDSTQWESARFQKIMILDEQKTGQIDILKQKIAPFSELYTMTSFSARAIELGPLNCNKATGVAELVEMMGTKMTEVMACGDYCNDKEMLSQVGYGIAVANANEEIKGIARYVASKSYALGVVEAIEKFCFGQGV